jgi:hypothetical protein
MANAGEKNSRQPIPKALEAKILLDCARRCALCFQIDLDSDEKEGQIAHLDHDPANNNEDNLAFLCLRHHSQYDSTTSQHKNYTIAEVKEARNKLCDLIARRVELSAAKGEKPRIAPREADRKALEDFLQILPSNGGIERLREFNFAGWAFEWDWFSDIKRFFYTRKDGPEHEFLDPDLERLRQELLNSINALLRALSHHTFYLKGSNAHASVPEEWDTEQPDRFKKAVDEIHKAADDTCSSYDAFVRAARSKLLA